MGALDILKIPTSYFKKQGSVVSKEAAEQTTLKVPVKFENGDRISGFTDKAQNTAFGYNKNGEPFTIKIKDLAMLQIVPKANNKTATKTEEAMRALIDKRLMEAQVTKRAVKMPEEPGLGTGVSGLDALLGSIFK